MNVERARIVVRGAVQGVGFRPFVYRLAQQLRLPGWVSNSTAGVVVEVEGTRAQLQKFIALLREEKPPPALIQSIESSFLQAIGFQSFEIRESAEQGGKSALILPDLATCADCLREILDPRDRRFRYPFTNCTNCGPRFSIIEALPYDRARTAMKKFAMCPQCAAEYGSPADRRFHAEPTACARCGPQLQFLDLSGENLGHADDALLQAAAEIRAGKIVALKGLGGYQLLVDAQNAAAIERLRLRKQRAEKPFALLFTTLAQVRERCVVSELEEQLLASPEAPIVLLRGRDSAGLPDAVAPGNPYLGVMLPCTPLHHLLLRELAVPVVATSGNLSDEPICIGEAEALERLGGIADFFLAHDRPIVRHMDDSIVRVIHGREMLLRRARGYAPLPIRLDRAQPTVLALGAHLKNTIALSMERNVFISQHIGDLATQQAHDAFIRAAADLPRLYDATPEVVAHDLHPDYLSTKHALQQPGRRVGIQHHWAHIASCMAEHGIEPPLLGVAWDGTGYGTDGTIWGGEFFLVEKEACRRVAHWRTFRLPGGDAAVKEPRRSALGLLHEIFGGQLWEHDELLDDFTAAELKTLRGMLEKKINSPATSSVGRLFDGVAALAGLRARSTFEGQAAMELEFAIASQDRGSYPFALREGTPLVLDWEPAVRAILTAAGPGEIAARFHHLLTDAIVAVARRCGQENVLLSGGCFQNRYLIERTIDQLRAHGFQPHWPQQVPTNDGGIALGQAYLATSPLREITAKEEKTPSNA